MRMRFLPFVALAATQVFGIADSSAGDPAGVSRLPTLDMFDQLSLEKRALRILAMPQVQRQKKEVEDLFRANKLAETPDGRAQLEQAANRFTVAAIEDAIAGEAARPKFMW